MNGARVFRGRATLLMVLATVLLLCCATGAARAAQTRFTGQFSPSSLPEGTNFKLSGDQVTAFSGLLRPTSCAAPADWRSSSDSVFELKIPAGAKVALSGGRFRYSGTAASADYGSGPSTSPYGGQFTISGTVNPQHTLVAATVTLSGAQDPFVSGCSGRYRFIAIPTPTGRAKFPDKAAYQSQFVSFDAAGGVVRNLRVQANFNCGPGSDSAFVDGPVYGYPSLRTTAAGGFSLTLHALDEYKAIVAVKITGTVSAKRAHGRIVVSEPPGGFVGQADDRCHGNTPWTAAKPVPPPPPGPSAYFQWAAIRVPGGAAYRYYFAATGLKCTDHATEVLVTVAHHTTTIPCSKTSAFATAALAPSHTYSVTSQAVQTTHGRIVKRGTAVTVPLQMPSSDDHWKIISGLPGTPPR
jgi:hypothetical protein